MRRFSPNHPSRYFQRRPWAAAKAAIVVTVVALSLTVVIGPSATAQNESDSAAVPKPESSLVVDAIRESNPQTPTARLRAAETLWNVGRPELARELLQPLTTTPLSPPDSAQVLRETGSAWLFRLSVTPELQPEGKVVADQILRGTEVRNSDSRVIAGWIAAIRGDDPARARRAMLEIRSASVAVVGPLLQALLHESNPTAQARLRRAVVQLGQPAIPPLMGGLCSDQPRLRAESLNLLAELAAWDATPFFLRASLGSGSSSLEQHVAAHAWRRLGVDAPERAAAESILEREIQARLAWQTRTLETSDTVDSLPTVMWRWDSAQETLVAESASRGAVKLEEAAHLAKDWLALRPERRAARVAFWAAYLGAEKLRRGLDARIPAAYWPPDIQAGDVRGILDQVLRCALQHQWEASAIGAIEALVQEHDSGGATPTSYSAHEDTLVDALRDSSRRVRLTAAWAWLRLNRHVGGVPINVSGAEPTWSQALRFLAATQGTPRIVVASPDRAQGDALASYVRNQGFAVDTVTTGRQLGRLLVTNPDYEMAFLVDTLDAPAAREVVQHLRQHPYTARLPIAVLSSAERLAYNDWIAADDPLTIVFPRLHDGPTASILLKRLLQLPQRERLTVADRLRHGAVAAEWLAVPHLQDVLTVDERLER